MFRRAGQHVNGLRDRRRDSVLHQHAVLHHPHQPLDKRDFRLEVTSQHKTPLSRQAEEGIRIMLELANTDRKPSNRKEGGESYKELVLLNSKSEFHQPLGGIRTFTKYLS